MVSSSAFVNKASEWDIDEEEVQVSYDVVALYPSVPITRAIDAMMEILSKDEEDLTTRTKFSLQHIRKLIQICLDTCYFLYENEIYVIDDAGPIGLSLMVVVSEAYLQFIEEKAVNISIIMNVHHCHL